MSKSAKSLFYFSIYLLLIGLNLLVAPNFLLNIFGLPLTEEVWIRVVGLLVLVLSVYYFVAVKHELTAIFHTSVYLRASVIVFFGAFVAMGLVKPVLLLFAGIDVAGAAWTYMALRQDKQ